MTEDEQNQLADAIGRALGIFVKELEAQINALRSEIKQFAFKGVFQEGQQYKRGNFCSQGGAIYHCEVDTSTRPGTDDKVWCLAVPRARDGRDGKDFTPEPVQRVTRSRR
jgi:hypothetical protein